jgi:hypothetical protein
MPGRLVPFSLSEKNGRESFFVKAEISSSSFG